MDRLKSCVSELHSFEPVELCNLQYDPSRGSSIDPHIDDVWLWGEQLVTINLLSGTILTLINKNCPNVEIQIPMPARSLLVLFDEARYTWMHCIKADHISDIRMAMTFRNLSDEFSGGGPQQEIGTKLIEVATNFDGTVIR